MRNVMMAATGAVCLSLSGAGQAAVVLDQWSLATNSANFVATGAGSTSDSDSPYDTDSVPATISHHAASSSALEAASVDHEIDSSLTLLDPQSLTFTMADSWTMTGQRNSWIYFQGGARVDYWFTITDGSYAFDIGYDVATGISNPFYDGGLTIELWGDIDPVLSTWVDFNGSGAFSGLLGPGSYHLKLDNHHADESFSAGVISGEGSASVSFTLTEAAGAVPEPASWAMMIGGFALAGGVLRRQRVKLALA